MAEISLNVNNFKVCKYILTSKVDNMISYTRERSSSALLYALFITFSQQINLLPDFDYKMAEFSNTFKAENTAVVLIEYQNEFCTPNGKLHP
jgi:hypothetical protein